MTTTPSPTSNLVDLPDSALWSSLSWPDFARLVSAKDRVVVLPLFGFADWGLGRPVDMEETLGCGILRAAFAADSKLTREVLVLPPLRFVLGPYPHTLFGIDFETALDLVREVATSVASTGMKRLILFNTSPWNEELAKTLACDLRVDLGLQTFVVNTAALGLDLHPTRSSTRAAVQSATCALTRRPPSSDARRADCRMIDFRPGDHRQPPPLPWSRSLESAVTEGWTALADAGSRLARLLREITAHPALPDGGVVSPRSAPKAKRVRQTKRATPARKKGRRTP